MPEGLKELYIEELKDLPNRKKATGLACRLYASSGRVPSEEMLRLAFSRARQREGA